MLKKLLAQIAAALMVLLSFSCKSKNISEHLSSIPMENREIPFTYDAQKFQNKNELSFTEMMEDLDSYIYLLESSYAGYDDALWLGMDVFEIKNQIQTKYSGIEKIQIEDFFQTLYDSFSPYIHDYHANLAYNGNYKTFIERYEIFFTDVYVQKKDSSYYTIPCEQNIIPVGVRFDDDKSYLFYYPSKGENVYRVGCIKADNEETISIKFGNQKYEIPVHNTKCIEEPNLYFVKNTDKSAYIKYNRCTFDNDTELNFQKAFSNSAKDYKNKEFLIIDLRGNYGGDNTYCSKFLIQLYNKNLNLKDFPNEEIREIYSYANIKAFRHFLYAWTDVNNPEVKKMLKEMKVYEEIIEKDSKKITKIKDGQKSNFDNPKFKGKIIFITDKNVASAGEDFILHSDIIFGNTNQIIQIGQNTSGALLYGNICDYYLPDSGLKCRLSITDFSSTAKESKRSHGEGYGLYPDYWSTNEDLNDTIFMVTKDKQMYEILKEIL